MNTDLLRTWLTLPPGPWPPDDRTILGLTAGPLATLDVEQCALAQMEKLRPHQLVHPDLVTEGMNRLAQALITLTEEANRASRSAPTSAKLAGDAEIVLDADLLGGKPRQPVVLEAEVVSVPRILDAPKAEKPRRRPRVPKVPKKKRRKERSPTDSAVDVPTAKVVPPGTTYSPAERRKGYRKLAQMRRVIRTWEKLQPYFAAPSEELSTPGAVFGYVESVRACRRTLAADGDADWFADHGQQVLTVVGQPLSLAVFRSLVIKQRQEVAADWALTTAHLHGRYLGLREEIQNTKPRKIWGSSARQVGRWLRTNPEWVLGLLVVLAVGVGLIRSAPRP
ncbi:hypothetical protein [Limnoglobus roseus]|uniref:Uncharacterized protein n=1 Tax=Limnoglobus roseus TaxID=2598579 RepID=A0A5C1AJV3_9BACT|nr:hypothetical protein [Limnoglobus roseus]QEL18457.1 hypothetical protein PX52LOC_05482 [Limnoglobus roseus]